MFLITSCRTRDIQASVANLVQGPSSQARISEPEDGGGNRRSIESVDYIKDKHEEFNHQYIGSSSISAAGIGR